MICSPATKSSWIHAGSRGASSASRRRNVGGGVRSVSTPSGDEPVVGGADGPEPTFGSVGLAVGLFGLAPPLRERGVVAASSCRPDEREMVIFE